MPSSYTTSGVELIGDGEQSGTWGGTTNTNLQIIDRMVSQAGTIALSGTTHTLTISDGVLSDGQYGVLVFGGSPSGTNTVTISPNDARRTYIVKNDSGQTVTLTQGSGGNVSVANGKTAIVYCDGAGSGAAVVDLTAALAVTALTLSDLGVTASASELNTLDGITATTAELNILDGVTATASELNILDGVTATASELNLLDGVTWTLLDYNTLTATATELNLMDGVTGKTGADTTLVTGTAGTDGQYAQWNADGDVVGVTLPTLAEATWEIGTDTTEALVSPAKARAGDIATINDEFNVSGPAPKYACRAWVNFDGTGTVAIRESGNVSSITDLGTGRYRVNLATAMPDANYVVCVQINSINTSTVGVSNITTTSFEIRAQTTGVGAQDFSVIMAMVFR